MAEQQDTQQQQQSPLRTERGTTTIQDGVVSKIVGIAAQEVDGVQIGGSASQTADNLLGSITGGKFGRKPEPGRLGGGGGGRGSSGPHDDRRVW